VPCGPPVRLAVSRPYPTSSASRSRCMFRTPCRREVDPAGRAGAGAISSSTRSSMGEGQPVVVTLCHDTWGLWPSPSGPRLGLKPGEISSSYNRFWRADRLAGGRPSGPNSDCRSVSRTAPTALAGSKRGGAPGQGRIPPEPLPPPVSLLLQTHQWRSAPLPLVAADADVVRTGHTAHPRSEIIERNEDFTLSLTRAFEDTWRRKGEGCSRGRHGPPITTSRYPRSDVANACSVSRRPSHSTTSRPAARARFANRPVPDQPLGSHSLAARDKRTPPQGVPDGPSALSSVMCSRCRVRRPDVRSARLSDGRHPPRRHRPRRRPFPRTGTQPPLGLTRSRHLQTAFVDDYLQAGRSPTGPGRHRSRAAACVNMTAGSSGACAKRPLLCHVKKRAPPDRRVWSRTTGPGRQPDCS